MGSWGNKEERRADRMPKLHMQPTEAQPTPPMTPPVPPGNDLGNGRIDELPLDNTKREHNDRLRPRRPPVIMQASEALNGYRQLAATGLDDDEAKGVQNLNDLGGPSVYRPSGGPSQNYESKPRPHNNAFAGMRTSNAGVLLPPGAEVKVFQSTKARGDGAGTNVVQVVQSVGGTQQTFSVQATSSQATGATQYTSAVSPQSATVKGSQQNPGQRSTSAAPGAQSVGRIMPPHMRKKTAETNSPPSSAQTTMSSQSTQIVKPTQPSQTIQAVKPTQSTATVQPAELAKTQTPSAAVTSPAIKASVPGDGPTANTTDSLLPDDRNLWSSPCKAKCGGGAGPWQDVKIELKVVFTKHLPEGHAVFILTHHDVVNKTHGLESYRCVYAKGFLVICSFTDSSDTETGEERYSIKFPDESTAVDFHDQCNRIKRVMEYILKHAISAKPEAVETSPKQEAETEPALERASDKTVVATHTHEPALKVAAAPKTDINRDASKTTGLEDAFKNLALDKVRGSSMYTADRTAERRQYTAEQLLERRSSAEIPPGVKEVKIPLQKDRGIRLPHHLQTNRRQESNTDLQAKAKLHQEWLSGTKTTADPHQESIASREIPAPASALAPAGEIDALVEIETNNQVVQMPVTEASIFENSEPIKEAHTQKPECTEARAAVESLISFQTSKSGVDSAVSVQPTSATPTVKDAALNNSLLQEGDNPGSMTEPTAQQPDAVDAANDSEQSTPGMPPAQANPLPSYTQGVQGMPPQMPTPIMGHPHMAGPAIYHPYGGQQIIESAMQHIPANGYLHAISVTYHVSQGPSSGQQNDGHQPAPTMYNTTQQLNTGPSFSPRAPAFQPGVQGQTVNNNGPKIRRGLESSRFATGFSGAKYAGSFTGIAADD